MSIVFENFRILLRPWRLFASLNLIWCVQFAVEPSSVLLCTSIVHYLPSLHRHFVRCSVSVAVVVCSARFTLSSRAPKHDFPASHKNNARTWLGPAQWAVTRRGVATGKRFNPHSDSHESLPVSSCGTPPPGACARLGVSGFALNGFGCSALWLLSSAGARHWRGLVGSHCAPLQAQAAERNFRSRSRSGPRVLQRVPPSTPECRSVRRPNRIGGALTLHLPCGRVRSALADGAASAVRIAC
jgi:hypothetical protein